MRSICSVISDSTRLLAVAGVGLFGSSQGGCLFGGSGPKEPMHASVENTSGIGTVQAKATPNGNTQLELLVKHLSSPSKVAADATVYVVWVQPRNAEIQNVGALYVDDDLVGKLETTTPHRSFTLTVTPEPGARMAVPTHNAVFTAEVNRKD